MRATSTTSSTTMPDACKRYIAVRTEEFIPKLKAAGWTLEFLQDGVRLTHGKKSVFLNYTNSGCSLFHKHEVESALDLIRLRTQ